jgi:prevent-host-death family protein
MDVPIAELRDHLVEWLERVRSGAEVVVTDCGIPVARLVGVSASATLQRVASDGVIGQERPTQRPAATGRSRHARVNPSQASSPTSATDS